MNKLIGFLAVLQVLTMVAADYNRREIENALPEAAAQGRDTFAASMTQDLFSSAGTSLTMVNGWKSPTIPNQCSVNLAYSDNGKPVEDLIGFILELHAPARRFTIADCRKLPDRIYQPYISG
jgi:hypothetical protein